MAQSSVPLNSPESYPPGGQSGVALIASLMVLAVIVAAASALSYQVHINTRRTQNVVASDQAWQVALSVESIARALLAADRANNDIDYLGGEPGEEPWFTGGPIRRQLRGNTRVAFAIADLQGRLNLNTLAGDLPPSGQLEQRRGNTREPNQEGGEVARGHLDRLIERAELSTGRNSLSTAVADWIDPDRQPRFPGGAEDDFYTRLEEPYRAANAPFASVSEFRLVKGMQGDEGQGLWDALCPFVSALPPDAVGINVNTAPSAVLATLASEIPASAAKAVVSSRQDQPYQSVQDLRERNRPLLVPELDTNRLQVDSRYFIVRVRVERSRAALDMYSILNRPKEGPIRVLHRSRTVPSRERTGEGSDGAEARACVGRRLDF